MVEETDPNYNDFCKLCFSKDIFFHYITLKFILSFSFLLITVVSEVLMHVIKEKYRK